ncbi:MAG: hypothetical protein HQ500_01145 [Flavobacteriales bacterium]|nr:hypothetical protein [Flavobacteriales bacterium]
MRQHLSICIFLFLSFGLVAQPPLSKKDQQRKADFEALIEREQRYEETLQLADAAFEKKQYVVARMAYQEAIQYDAEKEQWLTSKVNDLDILMARTAARSVDSIMVVVPKLDAAKLPTAASKQMEDRALDRIDPEVVGVDEIDSAQAIAEAFEPQREEAKETPVPVEKAEPDTPNHTVSARDIQLKPKAKPTPERVEKTKVKEDFKAFDNGVTEETFTLDNSTVLRVVVKEGIDVIVFKRVKHKWGGEFFFLDDQDVTRRYWEEQVRVYREKYPSDQE